MKSRVWPFRPDEHFGLAGVATPPSSLPDQLRHRTSVHSLVSQSNARPIGSIPNGQVTGQWRCNVGKLAKLGKRNALQANLVEKMMTDTNGEILTLDEVAAYLKAGKRTVYRLAQRGDIPAFKLGGTWRFRRSELDAWIAESIRQKSDGAK